MKDSLHAVFILTKLELGGAQKVCLSLFKGLKKFGAKTTLISGNEGPLVKELKGLDNVFLLNSFKREVGLKTIWLEIKTFFKIISILRKLKKETPKIIVHTHSTKAGLLGRFAALLAGVKVRVHTVHGFGFNDFQPKLKWFIIYFLEALVCLITTHYICVSNADLNEGSRRLPGFKKKSSIIRAAVEWEKFYIPAKKEKSFKEKYSFVFGSISCFKPQKNLFDLLKAFKIVFDSVSQKNLYLQIIGDGEQREDLEGWIKKNNLQGHVDLLGWQSDVSSWMQNWDAYVMSSLWEGLPIAIVEARMLKLPVVSYSIGGIPDIIVDGQNGYLVKPKKIKTLAEKMLSILKDKNLYEKMSLCKEDLSEFNDDFMIRKHYETFSKLF
ncbi:glycosyltransferase family 4 protein [Candidatus Babeliales bacterium]|nr:glycosyltransferase family 4 protein [Candidatus Babeliales bacterium]